MVAQIANIVGSGNSFIDQNHVGLLEHLISISETSSRNFNSEKFQLEAIAFLTDIEIHFSHEKTILKGADFVDLRNHIVQHRELALRLHKCLIGDSSFEEASSFIAYMRAVITEHEMLEDQKYWHLFETRSPTMSKLIRWTDELATGDTEIDRQH